VQYKNRVSTKQVQGCEFKTDEMENVLLMVFQYVNSGAVVVGVTTKEQVKWSAAVVRKQL
jgi:hypothetical protein